MKLQTTLDISALKALPNVRDSFCESLLQGAADEASSTEGTVMHRDENSVTYVNDFPKEKVEEVYSKTQQEFAQVSELISKVKISCEVEKRPDETVLSIEFVPNH